jgi:long-chain acyl-CoA synthetase
VTASPGSGAVPIENLASLLIDHPFGSNEPLLHTTGAVVTAGAARQRAHQIANDLRRAGVGPGHAVAVQLPNGAEAVVSMMAIWLADAIFVPINSLLPDAELGSVLGSTSPAAAIGLKGVRVVADPRRYEKGTAFILWTSGTTGRPKPILHTHKDYGELLDRVLTPLRSGSGARSNRPPSPNLIPVSLALNAGIYNALFGLRAGASLVIMDRFEPHVFADLVHRHEIRSTVLPPAALAMLNDAPDIDTLSPLKYVRSITAPLSPFQARRFTEKYGAFVLNGYGQAEIGEVIGWTAADAKSHPEKIGAVGLPHPGVALKILGEDGGPVEPGTVGELLVRPPTMARGYASGADLADRVDDEGYLATGDLARIDAEGFVWVEGRLGDLINRGGNKIFPDEVEEVLGLSPLVREVAVVGLPDDRLGQVPVAFVVSDADLDPAELESLVRDHLVPYKVPVDYIRIGSLPRNEAGKVLRNRLAAEHSRQSSAGWA